MPVVEMVEEVLMDMEEGQGPKDKDQARLMIRCIELENFKSYAGIKRIGPFHKVRSCCCFRFVPSFRWKVAGEAMHEEHILRVV